MPRFIKVGNDWLINIDHIIAVEYSPTGPYVIEDPDTGEEKEDTSKPWRQSSIRIATSEMVSEEHSGWDGTPLPAIAVSLERVTYGEAADHVWNILQEFSILNSGTTSRRR